MILTALCIEGKFDIVQKRGYLGRKTENWLNRLPDQFKNFVMEIAQGGKDYYRVFRGLAQIKVPGTIIGAFGGRSV